VAYDYDRRALCRVGSDSLPVLLQHLSRIVEGLAEHEAGAKSPPPDDDPDFGVKMKVRVAISVANTLIRRHNIDTLFLALLRGYTMVPTDRKVIERAIRTFSKRRDPRIKPEKSIETYLKVLEEYRAFLNAARRVLVGGQAHSEETQTTYSAGPFTLINTGGFSEATMLEAVKVVTKAAQQLTRKGLAKVCYGNVQITNTVGRSTRVLAFYRKDEDALYVRANLKGKLGPAVLSVTHELAHRLHFKFLKSKDRDIQLIYRQLGRKDEERKHALTNDRSKWPARGDTYVEKGVTYVVENIDYSARSRAGLVVVLKRRDDPTRGARLPLSTYIEEKHPELKSATFVSPYAATDHEENFAEMVAYYCDDALPAEQVQMLGAVL